MQLSAVEVFAGDVCVSNGDISSGDVCGGGGDGWRWWPRVAASRLNHLNCRSATDHIGEGRDATCRDRLASAEPILRMQRPGFEISGRYLSHLRLQSRDFAGAGAGVPKPAARCDGARVCVEIGPGCVGSTVHTELVARRLRRDWTELSWEVAAVVLRGRCPLRRGLGRRRGVAAGQGPADRGGWEPRWRRSCPRS